MMCDHSSNNKTVVGSCTNFQPADSWGPQEHLATIKNRKGDLVQHVTLTQVYIYDLTILSYPLNGHALHCSIIRIIGEGYK